MAGIYIHIPFCRQACNYCDFHFSTNISRKKELIDSICKEIVLKKDYLGSTPIETIYLGGGTPSLLNKDEINLLFDQLNKTFNLTNSMEVTLEANPDDLDQEKLKELKKSPINRLSIGVQSFFDEDLKFMNRAHNAQEATSSIKQAQDYGFDQISIDLIFGSPTTSNKMWSSNLSQFFDLNIPHLSAYSLTVEEKTALFHQINKGHVAPVNDEKNFEHYQILQKEIEANGYEQYELSNYCKNDHISKHNSSYWLGEKYLGLGPSAHSFNGASRQWNIRNNALYCKFISEGEKYFEKEELSEIDQYHEFLITSLRTKWGVNREKLKNSFSPSIISHFESCLINLDVSIIDLSTSILKVKSPYLFQSDEIVRNLMIDQD